MPINFNTILILHIYTAAATTMIKERTTSYKFITECLSVNNNVSTWLKTAKAGKEKGSIHSMKIQKYDFQNCFLFKKVLSCMW